MHLLDAAAAFKEVLWKACHISTWTMKILLSSVFLSIPQYSSVFLSIP